MYILLEIHHNDMEKGWNFIGQSVGMNSSITVSYETMVHNQKNLNKLSLNKQYDIRLSTVETLVCGMN